MGAIISLMLGFCLFLFFGIFLLFPTKFLFPSSPFFCLLWLLRVSHWNHPSKYADHWVVLLYFKSGHQNAVRAFLQ